MTRLTGHRPDNDNNNEGHGVPASVEKCRPKGGLIISWQGVPPDRAVRVIYKWSDPWPNKYTIEALMSGEVVADINGLPWDTVVSYLRSTYVDCDRDLVAWWNTVYARLIDEGGVL